jgi:hypothetical protein
MEMRAFAFLLILAGASLLLSNLAFADLGQPCADGTPYGSCSTKFPGQYCTGNLDSPQLGTLVSVCPCTDVPGYTQQGSGDTANCVATKCSDGTTSGQCAPNKPSQCVNGALVANSTACGCPSGTMVAPDGIFCQAIPCNDSGIQVKNGTCSANKPKMCISGQLVDKASVCKCPAERVAVGDSCVATCSDGTKVGSCSSTQPKKCVADASTGNGYFEDDAVSCGCPQGQSAVGTRCSTSVVGSIGGPDLLGTPSGNESGTASSGSSSALSCCCLPTALIGIAGGFVFFRKRK